jgi:hypothetical protein
MKLDCIKALHHEGKQNPWAKNIHSFQALTFKGSLQAQAKDRTPVSIM